MELRHAVLYGSEVTRLGEVATAAPTTELAAALSPGRLPKLPPPVDPNEDGVLVAARGGRVCLAVVDAHFGASSGEAALAALSAGMEDLMGSPTGGLAGRLRRLLDTVLEDVEAAVRAQPDSATALSIALADRRRLLAVTMGDTVVVRVSRRGRARRVGSSRPFAGAQAPEVRVDRVRLRRGDRLMVATDGLTDYLPSPWLKEVGAHVAEGPPQAAVQRLLDKAFTAGARDHVALAVWVPARR